eukprot:COSAG03_NODE_15799_length_420_cov_0.588785_1_plen_21_part_10
MADDDSATKNGMETKSGLLIR